MPGTGAGWHSILYSVHIIGGILGIVAVTVVVGFLDPTGQGPFWIPLIFGSITLWMAGFLGYWWVKLLFGGYTEPGGWVEQDGDDTPAVKALSSWPKLYKLSDLGGLWDLRGLKTVGKSRYRPLSRK